MGLTETLKRSAAALRDGGVPFALAGSAACWARGAPAPRNDIDFVICERDAERAEQALAAAGMRIERPPEGWLLKAWDDDVMIDLIWELEGCEDTDAVLARAEQLSVEALRMPVIALEDVMTSKLCAFDAHTLDFAPALLVARSLREQIDWSSVRRRTVRSPYARGFLALLEALGVIASQPGDPGEQHPQVRVVSDG